MGITAGSKTSQTPKAIIVPGENHPNYISALQLLRALGAPSPSSLARWCRIGGFSRSWQTIGATATSAIRLGICDKISIRVALTVPSTNAERGSGSRSCRLQGTGGGGAVQCITFHPGLVDPEAVWELACFDAALKTGTDPADEGVGNFTSSESGI
jgi:hypothetical protein